MKHEPSTAEKRIMRTTTVLAVTMIGMILTLFPMALNNIASAATAEKVISRASGANIITSVVEGDITTDFGMSVSETRDELCVSILQYTSTFEAIINIFDCAPIGEEDFSMSRNLDSASLDTTVTMFDEISQEEKTLELQASWSGESKLDNSIIQVHTPQHFPPSETGGAMVHITAHGLCRIASASATVGGDIALDVAVSAPVSEDDLISANICKSYSFVMEKSN
jgi:hypothetical protein